MPRKKKGNIGRLSAAARRSKAKRQADAERGLEDVEEQTEGGDNTTETEHQTSRQEEVNEESNGNTTCIDTDTQQEEPEAQLEGRNDATHPQNDTNPQQIVVEEAAGYVPNGATDTEDELQQQQQHRANKRSAMEEEEEEEVREVATDREYERQQQQRGSKRRRIEQRIATEDDEERQAAREAAIREAAIRRQYDVLAERTRTAVIPEYQGRQLMEHQHDSGSRQKQACGSRMVTAGPSELPEEVVETRMETTPLPQSSVPPVDLAQPQPLSTGARRDRIRRANESPDTRRVRLQRDNERTQTARQNETAEERRQRLNAANAQRRNNRKWTGRPGQPGCIVQIGEGFRYDPTKEYDKEPGILIGEMSVVCPHWQALKYTGEKPGMCCSGGTVVLEELEALPEALKELLTGQTHNSRLYLKHPRKYNSAFQMTSFGAHVERLEWASTFKVQGQVSHRMCTLLPRPEIEPKFLQIYFMPDMHSQADRRCRIFNNELDIQIVREMQHMLHDQNPIVQEFKTAMERHAATTYNFTIVLQADRTVAGLHPGQLNVPENPEVAALLVGHAVNGRDIVIQSRTGGLERVNELHCKYDALQYPLMFPTGQDGFHINIHKTDPGTRQTLSTKVSCNEFYTQRFMRKQGQTNHLLEYRDLANQYAVDDQAKVEGTRLLFHRLHNQQHRTETLAGLRDGISEDLGTANMGQVFILPSSYTGGARHMAEKLQDTHCYVKEYGTPDIFATMTCDPKNPGISRYQHDGQQSSHVHDVAARWFNQQVVTLMDALNKGDIFGPVQAYLYTVEWQKRGLPHIHLVVWLKEKLQPSDTDSVISAKFQILQQTLNCTPLSRAK